MAQPAPNTTAPARFAGCTGSCATFSSPFSVRQCERRNHHSSGAAVSQMELEHYPGMTEKHLQRIVEEAGRRWDFIDALVIHRVGEWQLLIGAMIATGTALAIFPLVTTVPVLIALAFFLGAGLGGAQPMIMSLLYNTAPAGRGGEASGGG